MTATVTFRGLSWYWVGLSFAPDHMLGLELLPGRFGAVVPWILRLAGHCSGESARDLWSQDFWNGRPVQNSVGQESMFSC